MAGADGADGAGWPGCSPARWPGELAVDTDLHRELLTSLDAAGRAARAEI